MHVCAHAYTSLFLRVCLFKSEQVLNACGLHRERQKSTLPPLAPSGRRPTPRRGAGTDSEPRTLSREVLHRAPGRPDPRGLGPSPAPPISPAGRRVGRKRQGGEFRAPQRPWQPIHSARGSPFGTLGRLSRPGARSPERLDGLGSRGARELREPRPGPRCSPGLSCLLDRCLGRHLAPGTSAWCPGTAQPLRCPIGPRSRDSGCQPQPPCLAPSPASHLLPSRPRHNHQGRGLACPLGV